MSRPGDTMESTGMPAHAKRRRTLKDSYECESRGFVQVKGKGEIETWLLHGQLPTAGVPQ
jgi:hypothetical protein